VNKKSAKPVIDSRHIKILSVKKDELKDSIVFVCLDEDKFGYYDVAQLRKLAEGLEKIEPDGCYFIGLKNLRVNIFEKAEIKHRDLIVTVDHPHDVGVDEAEVEDGFKSAFSEARSLKFVHSYVSKIERNPNP
jgi:hypothetical protein